MYLTTTHVLKKQIIMLQLIIKLYKLGKSDTMEFNEKLQELRKQKGLTQEELAEELYVSRAAVSKWEAGRGYPNIDSLKAIAKFFSVTIDDLLSGEELLTLAEEDNKEKEIHLRDLVFGLLDICTAVLLFLPIFADRTHGVIEEVSVLELTTVTLYMHIIYFLLLAAIVFTGVVTLMLQNCKNLFWTRVKSKLSLALDVLGVSAFVLSLQPYPAIFLLVFLTIKVFVLIKKP